MPNCISQGREEIHPIVQVPCTLVSQKKPLQEGFKLVAGRGPVYSCPYLHEQSLLSVVALDNLIAASGTDCLAAPPLRHYSPYTNPSFQINHWTVFSNAGASHGHLMVMLVGQGINCYLVLTVLNRKLTALLPASWKQEQAPSLQDEFT